MVISANATSRGPGVPSTYATCSLPCSACLWWIWAQPTNPMECYSYCRRQPQCPITATIPLLSDTQHFQRTSRSNRDWLLRLSSISPGGLSTVIRRTWPRSVGRNSYLVSKLRLLVSPTILRRNASSAPTRSLVSVLISVPPHSWYSTLLSSFSPTTCASWGFQAPSKGYRSTIDTISCF